ncbi:helix-turn-helix transcriptional regulator [Paenochrobactrum sp. BZR 588]|uniref:AraC family transcriptional regulator n=1 Tax=Paenochrobactrum TaxID=999488 RepID=UPI0035BC9565
MVSKRQAVEFDPDMNDRPVLAWQLDFKDYSTEIPVHRHRKGQLVLALHGAVTCQVYSEHDHNGMLMVPPNCGVWIPGGVAHCNHATANARLSFLFVEPKAAAMPQHCCTLSISPMVREMIRHLSTVSPDYSDDSHTARLVRVLLDELVEMPQEDFYLPVSDHPKIRLIADQLRENPADRATLGQWAKRVAMSERSLARLMVQETGLTFGRWRQQLHLIIALREISGGTSVQAIAEMLGYESPTAFITMFKKALGQTPTRYLAVLEGD